MAMIMASSERIRLRVSRPYDLDFIAEAESHPDNREFVEQWSREQHRAAQEDSDTVHLIIEANLEPAGYLIIAGLNNPADGIELKRIVITDKGKGLGRDTLRLVKRCAFKRWNASRLWLDVRSNNPRARHLYEAEGFVAEGTPPGDQLPDGSCASLILMSIPAADYKEAQ